MSDTIEPLQHTFVKEVIEREKSTLFDLIEAFGSAVHIVLPEVFQENIDLFKRVLEQYGMKYGIMYAAKANKGKSFLEMASKASI
jgi:diaminopimelate decarboxylase